MTIEKLFALLLALCMAMSCISALAEETTETQAQEDVVLAYVNGTPVMLSQVQDYVEYLVYYGYGDDSTEDGKRALYQEALNTAMGYVVMQQKAEAMGFTVMTEEETAELAQQVSEEWNEYVMYYASNYYGYDPEGTEQAQQTALIDALTYLESNGFTEESIMAQYADEYWYDKLVADICKDVSVSEEDAQASFLAMVSQDEAMYADNAMYYEYMTMYYGESSYYVPAGYRGVKQILLEVDEELLAAYTELCERKEAQENGEAEGDPVTDEMISEAEAAIMASVQDKLTDIRTRVDAGESFDALIAEYNTDPGMTAEPYASEGYSVHMDSIIYDLPFINAAFSVDTLGQVSEPYLGAYGIYIVQYFRDIPEGPVAYTDELKASFMEAAQADAENEALNTQVDAWLKDADVIYTVVVEDYLPYPDAEAAQE